MRIFFIILLLIQSTQAICFDDYGVRLDSVAHKIYNTKEHATLESELVTIIRELKKLPKTRDNVRLTLKAQYLFCEIKLFQFKYDESLPVLLEIIEKSNKYNLPEYTYKSYLALSMVKEYYGFFTDARKDLNNAYNLATFHNLDSIISTYYVRKASFFRFLKQNDSAIIMATEGIKYATRFKNTKDETDCYLLLGITLPKNQYKLAAQYYNKAANLFLQIHDYEGALSQYYNLSKHYLNNGHIDSSEYYYKKLSEINKTLFPRKEDASLFKLKSDIFSAKQMPDSALKYFKLFHDSTLKEFENDKSAEIKKITYSYESSHKEDIIKNQKYWLLLLSILAIVIIIFSFILFRKNRKINTQNKIINLQVEKLSKLLAQKETILHEMHHRVKNNLQNVISILEMQKESIDYNNIEELIRSNQNRIHSMALLHKKLNRSEVDREINLPAYIRELTELVMDSYRESQKNINFNLNCTVQKISLDKAMPLGLIAVELVSNSMKHAFKGKSNGIISIDIFSKNSSTLTNFFYMDNGIGYDFDTPSSKGLGLEIINGLIDQLDGKIESHNDNGFSLSFVFNHNTL
ncbi:MAG TPA: sensor histidine kinase [Saprospiraceae bacterium]|nr:sensor histidine kinase [Saprospiraceae bacterium]